MSSLGVPEMVLVGIFLLLIGPEELPDLGALRNVLKELQLTRVQKGVAAITMIALAVMLGLLLTREVGWIR